MKCAFSMILGLSLLALAVPPISAGTYNPALSAAIGSSLVRLTPAPGGFDNTKISLSEGRGDHPGRSG